MMGGRINDAPVMLGDVKIEKRSVGAHRVRPSSFDPVRHIDSGRIARTTRLDSCAEAAISAANPHHSSETPPDTINFITSPGFMFTARTCSLGTMIISPEKLYECGK